MRLTVDAYNEQSRTNVFCRQNLHQKSFRSVDGPDERNFVNNGQSIANHLRFTSTDQKFYNRKSLISETDVYLFIHVLDGNSVTSPNSRSVIRKKSDGSSDKYLDPPPTQQSKLNETFNG